MIKSSNPVAYRLKEIVSFEPPRRNDKLQRTYYYNVILIRRIKDFNYYNSELNEKSFFTNNYEFIHS